MTVHSAVQTKPRRIDAGRVSDVSGDRRQRHVDGFEGLGCAAKPVVFLRDVEDLVVAPETATVGNPDVCQPKEVDGAAEATRQLGFGLSVADPGQGPERDDLCGLERRPAVAGSGLKPLPLVFGLDLDVARRATAGALEPEVALDEFAFVLVLRVGGNHFDTSVGRVPDRDDGSDDGDDCADDRDDCVHCRTVLRRGAAICPSLGVAGREARLAAATLPGVVLAGEREEQAGQLEHEELAAMVTAPSGADGDSSAREVGVRELTGVLGFRLSHNVFISHAPTLVAVAA